MPSILALKQLTLRAAALAVLASATALGGCGGGENQAGGGTGGTDNTPAPANNTPSEPDPPKADPDAWRKIKTAEPAGWSKLAKPGYEELQSNKHNILKKPVGDFVVLGSVGTMHAPHATSGTDEEWATFRNQVSAAMLYNVSKSSEDAAATLKRHGATFMEGYNEGAIKPDGKLASLVNGDHMLVAVSLPKGTYIITAIARSDADRQAVMEWAKSVKPE